MAASHKADGRFAMINLYPLAFDPQNPLNSKYLITIHIRKGTLDTFMLLDDILHHMGTVVDSDMLAGNHHHMITTLVFTTFRESDHNAYMELEN